MGKAAPRRKPATNNVTRPVTTEPGCSSPVMGEDMSDTKRCRLRRDDVMDVAGGGGVSFATTSCSVVNVLAPPPSWWLSWLPDDAMSGVVSDGGADNVVSMDIVVVVGFR